MPTVLFPGLEVVIWVPPDRVVLDLINKSWTLLPNALLELKEDSAGIPCGV